MPPRGNNTERMQLCGLSKARPISCSDCPAFHRLQTSRFSIAESPNRCPGLMPTPPLHSRLTSDGVASTRRVHRVYQDVARSWWEALLSSIQMLTRRRFKSFSLSVPIILGLIFGTCSAPNCSGYSVLTHEAIIDA